MMQDDTAQSCAQLLHANQRYADSFDRSRLAVVPAKKLVVAREAGVDAGGLDFLSFSHVEEHVRTQVKKVRNSPFVRPGITVQGLVYQVEDGRLREVV